VKLFGKNIAECAKLVGEVRYLSNFLLEFSFDI